MLSGKCYFFTHTHTENVVLLEGTLCFLDHVVARTGCYHMDLSLLYPSLLGGDCMAVSLSALCLVNYWVG